MPFACRCLVHPLKVSVKAGSRVQEMCADVLPKPQTHTSADLDHQTFAVFHLPSYCESAVITFLLSGTNTLIVSYRVFEIAVITAVKFHACPRSHRPGQQNSGR